MLQDSYFYVQSGYNSGYLYWLGLFLVMWQCPGSVLLAVLCSFNCSSLGTALYYPPHVL